MARYDAAHARRSATRPSSTSTRTRSSRSTEPSGIAYSMDRSGGDELLRYDIRAGWRPLAPLPLDRTARRRSRAAPSPATRSGSRPADDHHAVYRVDIDAGAVHRRRRRRHRPTAEGGGIDAGRACRRRPARDASRTPTGGAVTLDHFRVTGEPRRRADRRDEAADRDDLAARARLLRDRCSSFVGARRGRHGLLAGAHAPSTPASAESGPGDRAPDYAPRRCGARRMSSLGLGAARRARARSGRGAAGRAASGRSVTAARSASRTALYGEAVHPDRRDGDRRAVLHALGRRDARPRAGPRPGDHDRRPRAHREGERHRRPLVDHDRRRRVHRSPRVRHRREPRLRGRLATARAAVRRAAPGRRSATASWLGHGTHRAAGRVDRASTWSIGAGSVVTGDLPGYSVAVGNPARVIRRYDAERAEWVRVARRRTPTAPRRGPTWPATGSSAGPGRGGNVSNWVTEVVGVEDRRARPSASRPGRYRLPPPANSHMPGAVVADLVDALGVGVPPDERGVVGSEVVGRRPDVVVAPREVDLARLRSAPTGSGTTRRGTSPA